jgi:hypothetical protein
VVRSWCNVWIIRVYPSVAQPADGRAIYVKTVLTGMEPQSRRTHLDTCTKDLYMCEEDSEELGICADGSIEDSSGFYQTLS